MTTEAAAPVADATTTTTTTDVPVANMADLKRAVEARDALKKERDALAAKVKSIEESQMTEQQKIAARLTELEPKAAKLERYEAVIGSLLESELATVPEDMRDIVPATLAPEERLDWLRQAKAKGLFKAAEPVQKPEPTDSPIPRRATATGKVLKRSTFDKMSPYAQAEHIKSGGAVED